MAVKELKFANISHLKMMVIPERLCIKLSNGAFNSLWIHFFIWKRRNLLLQMFQMLRNLTKQADTS